MADKATRSKVLSDILHDYGEIRTSKVVELSTPVDAPLHDEFEWDDTKAGHEHRLWQARRFIRLTVVQTEDVETDQKLYHIPEAVTDGSTKEGCYLPISIVVQDPNYSASLGELETKIRGLIRAVEELRRARGDGPGDPELLDSLKTQLQIVRETISVLRSMAV